MQLYYFFSQYVLKCTFFFAIGSTFAVEVQYSTKQEKYEIKINDEKSTQDVGTADMALVHDEGCCYSDGGGPLGVYNRLRCGEEWHHCHLHSQHVREVGAALDPNVCGQLTLSITGLAPGQHTIQTYHNSWQDPSRTAAWPITLSIGGQVVHKSVTRTIQQTVASDACVLTTVFSVSSSDESIVMPDNTFLHKSNSLPLCENIKKAPFHRCFLNNKRVCAFFHSCCALFTHYNNI